MMTRGHILVVEDNEATRYAVARILVNAGYQVTAAESGELALELVASARPDLVLLDVKLPDVSGFDVARRLKADPSTAAIPLVHLSATSVSTAEQVRGLEGGADAYLTHPIEPRVLVATLDALLRARRAETRYRKLFDTGLLGILTWDADGVVVDANDAFLALAGYGREDVAHGRLRWDVLLSWPDGTERAGRNVPPGGQPQEMALARRDGQHIPVLVGRASNGDHDHAVAFVLDITDRKQAEEALQEADRRKDEFLAVLSHELRNPLAPIRNAVALLGRAPLDASLALRARQILERQTQHLTRLVDDLLDVTRVARGKVRLQRTRVDLVEVVRKATEDQRSTFDGAGVGLQTTAAEGPIWIDADPTRISQVVSNLLQNAVKFTPRGGNVSVVVAAAGDRAEVRVRDDGIGIEPDQLQDMFEPFAQADRSLARTQGGLGLGLSLVRGLVELHGGTVAARSEGRGLGSEFTVALPRALTAAAVEVPPAEGGTAVRAVRVLVVEDNADAARTLADLLELRGHQVWTATGGRAGVTLALEVRPDVVLCDVGLPDIDGYEVARALRRDERTAGTRLLALSGYAQPEDRQRALAAGFDGHVSKPPTLERLEELFGDAPRSGSEGGPHAPAIAPREGTLTSPGAPEPPG